MPDISGGGYNIHPSKRAASKSRKPRKPPAAIFGPIGRADAPITRARTVAHKRTERATRKVNRTYVAPALPKLRQPTASQRAAARTLTAKSLHRRGITTREEIAQLPVRQRRRVNRGIGYGRTNLRNANLAAGPQALAIARMMRVGAKEGRPHSLVTLGPASLDLTAIGRTLAGATTLGQGDLGPRNFAKASLRDVASIGTAPAVIGSLAADAAWQAVRHGNTRPAVKLGTDLAKGLKTAVVESPVTKLATGHPLEAGEAFRQHPVFAALDVTAAGAVVGRTAGAAARTVGSTAAEATGVRAALGRAGSTVRPALALNEDGGLAHVQRSYSKDLIRKSAQVAADQAREPLLHPDGTPVTVVDRGREVPVLKPLPGERAQMHKRRIDFTASRANSRERMAREVTGHEAGQAGRVGSRGDHAARAVGVSTPGTVAEQVVSLASQGVLRPGEHFAGDLTKRIERIGAQIAHDRQLEARGEPVEIYRHSGELKDATAEVKALMKLRSSPRAMAQAEQIVEAGRRVGRGRRAQDAREVPLGTLDAAVAARAPLEPYAISHMDARHVTVEEHAALEREARQVERQARAKVDALPKGADRAKALAQWRAARSRRIEVSGREPQAVHAHEHAATQERRAAAALERADARVRTLERSRARVSGAQSVQRGAESARRMKAGRDAPTRARGVLAYIDDAGRDEGRLLKGAEKERQRAKVAAKVDRQLKQAREKQRAARKAHAEAKRAASGTKLPDAQAALRHPDGRFLSNAEIESHMRAHGVDPADVGHLSHRALGNRAHHKRFDVQSRGHASTERRTGSALAKGTSGFGPGQVEDSAVNAATRIVKAEQVDRFIHDNGLKHPAASKPAAQRNAAEERVVERGGYFTAKEGLETAERLRNDTGREYVAVRAFPASTSKATREAIQEAQSPAAMSELSSKLLNDRVVTEAVGPASARARNVVLVPLEDMNRQAEHLAPAGELEKLAQMLNRPFRFSVLAQPRWLTGNFIEPYFVRLPTVGSGVVNIPGLALDIRTSLRSLKSMENSADPAERAAAAEIQAQQLGGLFIGGRGASNRRRARDSESSVIQAGAYVRDLPVVKQMGDLLGALPTAYFRINRQVIEQWAQHAALGHQIRADVREVTGSWAKAAKLGESALADARRGLIGTPAQERFMRAQHELLGKYEGFSPKTRRLVQTVMPFLPWALSAARFVFWTMPAHHTILSTLLLRSEQAVDQAWRDEHTDAPPGGLQYALRNPDGGFVDFSRYTPYGLTAPIVGGDAQGITDQFMPQLSGASAAIQGKDPFGRDLKVRPTADNPKGTPSFGDKLLIALNSALESTLGPYPSMVRRLEEHGETGFSNSYLLSPKTKPGTSHGLSGVRRTFDPFRPVYLGKGSAAALSGPLVPSDPAQAILAGARGHVTADPSVSEAQKILAGARGR